MQGWARTWAARPTWAASSAPSGRRQTGCRACGLQGCSGRAGVMAWGWGWGTARATFPARRRCRGRGGPRALQTRAHPRRAAAAAAAGTHGSQGARAPRRRLAMLIALRRARALAPSPPLPQASLPAGGRAPFRDFCPLTPRPQYVPRPPPLPLPHRLPFVCVWGGGRDVTQNALGHRRPRRRCLLQRGGVISRNAGSLQLLPHIQRAVR